MNRTHTYWRLPLAALLLLHGAAAFATVDVCVATIADLQTALIAADSAADDTIIRIVRGTYSPNNPVSLASVSTHDLIIEGGYDAACVSTSADSEATVLDGRQLHNADDGLRLVKFSGNLTLRYLTLQNFSTNNEVFRAECHDGDMLVENNRFLHNTVSAAMTAPYYFDAVAGTHVGSMTIRNNLIVSTKVPDGIYAMTVFPTTSDSNVVAPTYFTNNTVVGTIGSGSAPGGGVYLFTAPTSTPATLSNNILWNNAGGDLTLLVPAMLDHNDVGVQTGPPNLAGSSGNVSVNPQFGGGGNYALSAASPLLDQGDPSAAGGVGAFDVWGMPRVSVADTIDPGAFQHDRIFLASFD
ncbi:MAG TPA: hypothetical protein VF132_09230 [Rudaea sp.]